MGMLKKLFKRRETVDKQKVVTKELHYLEFLKTMFSALPVNVNTKTFANAMNNCQAICCDALQTLSHKPCVYEKSDMEFGLTHSPMMGVKEIEYLSVIEFMLATLPHKFDTEVYLNALNDCSEIVGKTKQILSGKVVRDNVDAKLDIEQIVED